jgi:hypothetical protein
MALHLFSITFDAADPQSIARFWADVTGYSTTFADDNIAILGGDGSVGPRMMFIKVPEGKTAKNRMHVDLGSTDLDGGDRAGARSRRPARRSPRAVRRHVGHIPRSRGQRVLHRPPRATAALSVHVARKCERRDSNPQAPKGTGS